MKPKPLPYIPDTLRIVATGPSAYLMAEDRIVCTVKLDVAKGDIKECPREWH